MDWFSNRAVAEIVANVSSTLKRSMQAMPQRKILITGASGFIGGALFRAFRDAGWSVNGIGRRSLNWEQYISHDLSLPIPEALQQQLGGTDVVLHAAARSSPWGTPRDFYDANVVATENVVQLSERLNVSKLIFLSSSSVYYRPEDQLGIRESTPQAAPPVNLYAASKQAGESIVRKSSRAWCILRPRAVYGVGDSVLFPRILKAAQAERLPLLIRQGEPVIGDLLSVANLVDVCVKAADDESIRGDFNLTDDHPVALIAFLLELFERLAVPVPRRRLSTQTAFRMAGLLEKGYAWFAPRREPPITRFGVHVFAYSKTFDVHKMLQTFGPPKQTVEQAVRDFVDWVRSDSDPYDLRHGR